MDTDGVAAADDAPGAVWRGIDLCLHKPLNEGCKLGYCESRVGALTRVKERGGAGRGGLQSAVASIRRGAEKEGGARNVGSCPALRGSGTFRPRSRGQLRGAARAVDHQSGKGGVSTSETADAARNWQRPQGWKGGATILVQG